MAFRRGFKAQCEKRAVELRKQFGYRSEEPLSASEVADHLDVGVWSAGDIHGLKPADAEQLFNQDPKAWSAFTLRIMETDLIVYNPSQNAARINSVTMHELSHIILGHDLHDVMKTDDGQLIPGNYDQDQEDEANWLGGTLLLPRPALLSVRRRRLSDQAICDEYLVSRAMFKWRVRMTGVDYQISK